MRNYDSRWYDKMEKHVQTIILAVITALILWVGSSVNHNKDGITRLNVTVENILKHQTEITRRIDEKADKADLHVLSNENARQWNDIKLNNQARQGIKFNERDITELERRVDELKESVKAVESKKGD